MAGGSAEGELPRPRLWSGVWAVAKLVPRAGRWLTVLVVGAALTASVAPVAYTVVSGKLVGSVPAVVGAGLGSAAGTRTLVLLASVAGLFLLQHVAQQALVAASHTLQRRVDGMLRETVVRASLGPVGIGHLEDPTERDVFSLARNLAPTGYTPGAAARGLAVGNTSRLSALLSAGVVATYSWPLALALVAASALTQAQLLVWLFRNIRSLVWHGPDQRAATYYRDLALTPPAAKEVRVFGLQRWIDQRFGASWRRAIEEAWAERRRSRGQVVVTAAVTVVATGGALAYVGARGLSGELDLEAVAVLLGASVAALAFTASDFDLAVAYGAAAVPAILAAEDAAATLPAGDAGRPAAGLPSDRIEVRDLDFCYPGTDEVVFEGLDLTIPAGQRLAIVGLNGAGKTTLVKLLCRLYEPDAGEIRVDGVSLAELAPRAWRRQVAALFQDYVRYHLSALDNVVWAAGVDERPEQDAARAAAAAGRVGAQGIVEDLEHGWATVLSPQYERGTDLSGGQWQRIALARALAKVDAGAQLLILDEPTANLDVRAEAELYDRFIDLTAAVNRGRPLTTILISHRFSTVRRADRIVVLEQGHVVEDGTHDRLLALGGRYAGLFHAQAARFDDAAAATGGDGT